MAAMAILLAVETSGTLCSLAIHAAGRWFEDTQNVERLHNRVVLTALERLAERAGVGRRDFEVVAFGAGPGSFTGIRIATSVAQGVAYAAGASVVPVPSSRALALALASTEEERFGEVVTVTRSRRDAHYLAAFRLAAGALPERLQQDHLHQGDAVPADLSADSPGIGDRPPWWPEGREFIADVAVTGRTVGELALALLEAGAAVPPEQALPIYVTGDSPWQPAKS